MSGICKPLSECIGLVKVLFPRSVPWIWGILGPHQRTLTACHLNDDGCRTAKIREEFCPPISIVRHIELGTGMRHDRDRGAINDHDARVYVWNGARIPARDEWPNHLKSPATSASWPNSSHLYHQIETRE